MTPRSQIDLHTQLFRTPRFRLRIQRLDCYRSGIICYFIQILKSFCGFVLSLSVLVDQFFITTGWFVQSQENSITFEEMK